MPWLPLATAPKSSPTAVAARIPTSAAVQGAPPGVGRELGRDQPGHAEQSRLGQGDHAAVAGQERQADRGEAQPQRGESHLAGDERREQHRYEGDHEQDDGERAAGAEGPRPFEGVQVRGGVSRGVGWRGSHSAFPNRPVGRTARIAASRTKVSRAERFAYSAGR